MLLDLVLSVKNDKIKAVDISLVCTNLLKLSMGNLERSSC